jgi:hypothetical protein
MRYEFMPENEVFRRIALDGGAAKSREDILREDGRILHELNDTIVAQEEVNRQVKIVTNLYMVEELLFVAGTALSERRTRLLERLEIRSRLIQVDICGEEVLSVVCRARITVGVLAELINEEKDSALLPAMDHFGDIVYNLGMGLYQRRGWIKPICNN